MQHWLRSFPTAPAQHNSLNHNEKQKWLHLPRFLCVRSVCQDSCRMLSMILYDGTTAPTQNDTEIHFTNKLSSGDKNSAN